MLIVSHRWAIAAYVLVVMIVLVIIGSQIGQDEPEYIIEETVGNMRTVNRLDRERKPHGLQEIYFIHEDGQEVLIYERMVEHGYLIWMRQYDDEGNLMLELEENDHYELVETYNRNRPVAAPGEP